MKTPVLILRALTVSALAGLACSQLSADILTFTPTADATIRSDQPSVANNTNVLLVGTVTASTNPAGALRSLLSFDLSSAALDGATINSVTLTLRVNNNDSTSTANTMTLDLTLLPSSFTESGTWLTSNGSTSWTAGSPYTASPILSSTTGIANSSQVGDTYTFASTSALTSVVSASVSSTGILNFVIKLDDETLGARNIFRFTSSEPTTTGGVTAAFVPTLTIDYTAAAIPEPSTFALLGGLAALGFVAVRRRR